MSEDATSVPSKADCINAVFELYQIARGITRKIELKRDSFAKKYQVNGSQLYLLWSLYNLEECTYSQLAQQCGFAVNSISGAIKTLVKKGVMEQRPDPNDGRVTYLRVSKIGMDIINDLIDAFDAPTIADLGKEVLRTQDKAGNATSVLIDTIKAMGV